MAYRIEVSWASDDEVWVADVPDLPYCSAHGASPHEAVEQVERAVEAWLDAAHAKWPPAANPHGQGCPSLIEVARASAFS